MKKRFILGLVFAVTAAGMAFALPEFRISAGAGGYFTSDFGGGVEASLGDFTQSMKIPYIGGGGFLFFDATYAELSLGFFGGGGEMKKKQVEEQASDMSYMGLDIGLLGKFPFTITEKLSLFPMLGLTYRVMLSVKDEDGNTIENSDGDNISGDFSALWFKLGGGVDFSFTDHIYLRGGLLYGLRLPNKYENDTKDFYDDMGADVKTLLGHGLEVKIAVGYKF